MNVEEKQKLLDAQIEPQTMTYQLENLTPTGNLLERVKAFRAVGAEFFTAGERLLDVGCAKGYFSFIAANAGLQVKGIDPNRAAIDLCNELTDPSNPIEFDCCSFRDLWLEDVYYDRIFIGNGPHYMFVGSGGNWDWIDKLAVLSSGHVLLEGGFDFEDPQMNDLIPEHARSKFTWEQFKSKAELYFHIIVYAPSPVKGRHIVLLEKKKDLDLFREVQLYDLPIHQAFRLGWKEHSTLFYTELQEAVFAKLYPIGCRPQTLQLSSMFSKTSNIKAIIKFEDQYAGCCETFHSHPTWGMLDDIRTCARIYCEYQIFLIRQGHIDIDANVGNFVYNRTSREARLVDKNQIYPIQSSFDERHSDSYVNFFKDPELNLPEHCIDELGVAMRSGDSYRLEAVFETLLAKLS
jgi:SAM-dependent methyltransferase